MDESEGLIAPAEMRELLTRLTEHSIEGIRPSEARTVAGLALETGIPAERIREALGQMRTKPATRWPVFAAGAFAVLALATWLIVHRTSPEPNPPAVVPSVVAKPQIVTAGLVDLKDVSYGPDQGPFRVDPSFEPPVELPSGISISASVDKVLWGAGDRRGEALSGALTKVSEDHLRRDLVELLKFVRMRAAKRNLPLKTTPGDYRYHGDSPGYVVDLSIETFSGNASSNITLPPPGAENDAEALRIIKNGVDQAMSSLESGLKDRFGSGGP